MLEEKYRPKTLDDVIGQNDVIEKIQMHIQKPPQEVPHFLFHGGSGVGKTATAGAIVNELNADMIELNASDDRGIDTMRNRVITAMKSAFLGHKIIFMDEADMLTEESQRALRRPLEIYRKTTVIMSCNTIEKISPYIQDRMTVYHFEPIQAEDMIARLQYIAEQEGITDVDYTEIVEQAHGSMRKAIILLEDGAGTRTSVVNDELKQMAEQMGL